MELRKDKEDIQAAPKVQIVQIVKPPPELTEKELKAAFKKKKKMSDEVKENKEWPISNSMIILFPIMLVPAVYYLQVWINWKNRDRMLQ